jgi:porin
MIQLLTILPVFLYVTFLTLVALALGERFSGAAYGQAMAPGSPSAVRCPSPANPGGLYFECAGQPFDFIEETFTEEWAGLRTELKKLGITPTASYTAQFMGNPSGGGSRGFTYAGTLQAAIFWDINTHIPGLSFNIGGAWSTGKNLSADYIGNTFAVQSAYSAPGNGSNNLTLGEIYFRQQLFGNSLVLAAGRLAPQSTFATMPVLGNYLNAGINPVAGSLGVNDASFTSYPPGVEWGAQAIYNLTPELQLAAGVFNTNPRSAAGARGGLEFSLQQGNRGALSVAQLNYLFNHAPQDTGLPGQYTLGGFYDSNEFNNLRNSDSRKSGTYGIYAMFQQMVFRDGDAKSQRGLTVWAETSIEPKASVNAMPYFAGAGLTSRPSASFTGLLAATFLEPRQK